MHIFYIKIYICSLILYIYIVFVEYFARKFRYKANDLFKTNCKLNYIKVWESPKAAVIYRKDA